MRWLVLLAVIVVAAACGNQTGLTAVPAPSPSAVPSAPTTATPPDCSGYPIGPDPNITATFPLETDLNPCGNANFDVTILDVFDGDGDYHRCFWENIARPAETPHSEYEEWNITAGDGDNNSEGAVVIAPPCVLHP